MTDKLEALKALADEIAPGYRQKWGCEDGINNDSISVGTYNADGDICPFIEVSISDWSGNDDDNEKLAKFIALANPPVVSELLAALEEKDQQIKELEEFAKLALEKIPNEKVSPDFYIVGNGPCFLAYPESMGPEARGDLAGNLRKAYLSPTHWKQRAEAAEQRLQQPIKLPDIRSEDYHESGWFQHMKYYRDVVRSIQVLELKVEGE